MIKYEETYKKGKKRNKTLGDYCETEEEEENNDDIKTKIALNILGFYADIVRLWHNLKRDEPLKIKLTRIWRDLH